LEREGSLLLKGWEERYEDEDKDNDFVLSVKSSNVYCAIPVCFSRQID